MTNAFHLKPSSILVVMALPEEGGHYFEKAGIRMIYTGIGKVNASYVLTKAIIANRPKLVINFGTAGSVAFQRGEMVSLTAFVQRDINLSPLGFANGETPFEKVPRVLQSKNWFEQLKSATCGTGDNFETAHAGEEYNVVDMEAYALAKVCHLEQIDFAAVKFISDGADEDASAHWEESVQDAPAHFLDLFRARFS